MILEYSKDQFQKERLKIASRKLSVALNHLRRRVSHWMRKVTKVLEFVRESFGIEERENNVDGQKDRGGVYIRERERERS